MAINSSTTASDISSMSIDDFMATIQSTPNTSVPSLTQTNRVTPASVTRSAKTTNAFTTHSVLPNIKDIDFKDKTNDFSKYSNLDLSKLEESFGAVISSQEDLEEALSASTSNITADMATALSFIEADPSLSLSEAADFTAIKSALADQASSLDFTKYESLLSDGYSTVTDAAGNLIDGISSSVDYKTFIEMNALANKLCGNGLISAINFGVLKNLYNILMQALIDNDLAAMLATLLKCQTYADRASINNVVRNVPGQASKGNTSMVSTIVNSVGAGRVSNYKDVVRTLSKTSTNTKSTSDQVASLLNSGNLTPTSIYTKTTANATNILNKPTVAKSQSKVSDSILGSVVSKMVSASPF